MNDARMSPEEADSEDEVHRPKKLAVAYEQAREILPIRASKITCPCGHCATILFMYRCAICGIYFCTACSRRHFGIAEEGAAC